MVKDFATSSGLLSLRWNNHATTILKLLDGICNKNQYEDATVACGGKLYPVHRLVLACCSSYFEQMFAHTNGKHSIIVLKDVSCEVFEALLKYMYIGVVEVRKEQLGELITAAACLEIKGLAVSEEYQGYLANKSIDSVKRCYEDVASASGEDDRNSVKLPKTDHESSMELDEEDSVDENLPSISDINVIHNDLTNEANFSDENIKTSIQLVSGPMGEDQENEDSEEDVESSNQALELEVNEDQKSASLLAKLSPISGAVLNLQAQERLAVAMLTGTKEFQNDSAQSHLLKAALTSSQDALNALMTASLKSDESESSEIKKTRNWMTSSVDNHIDSNVNSLSSHEAESSSLNSAFINENVDNGSGNLDIYSMLDLHYEEGSGGNSAENIQHNVAGVSISEALDPELAALLAVAASTSAGTKIPNKSPILRQHWQCPQCDYSTPVKQYITQHIRRHTGEKPFKCGLCDYRAAQKQSVTYHMRRHTGEKPFKCPHCPYRSSSRQNLDRHVRRHTGEMPYGCPYCSYRSITKGPVVDHMRAKHGERECDKSLVLKLETKSSASAQPTCEIANAHNV